MHHHMRHQTYQANGGAHQCEGDHRWVIKEESEVYCKDCGVEGHCTGCGSSFGVDEPQECVVCDFLYCTACTANGKLEEVLSRRESNLANIERGPVYVCLGLHPVPAVVVAAVAGEEECDAREAA